MLKLKVRIDEYTLFRATLREEDRYCTGYLEGYSGNEVLVYLPNSNNLISVPIKSITPIGYEEIWVEKETKE